MAIEVARTYPGISPKAYEHPADRAATAAIHSIPLMDRLLKRLSSLGLERRHNQVLLGNAVRLGADQIPAVWELHTQAASCLDVSVPPLYVTQTPVVNGMTIGSDKPIVIISSSLVGGFDQEDLRSVLAHEMGHVLSEHFYYTSVLTLLASVATSATPITMLAGLPVRALYLALLEWSRAAELSCDRASAIVLADPLATCGALMRVAGGPLDGLDLQAFLRQASEYVEEEDLFSRRARFGLELSQRHPFAVRRVRELVDWVESGEYDRIVGGSYIRRGEEPPMSAQFESAVQHYRERFTAMIDRTVGGVGKLATQIQTWLRGHPEDEGDEFEPDMGGDGDTDGAD
jgi:Zn-dependent protease with chaperone function